MISITLWSADLLQVNCVRLVPDLQSLAFSLQVPVCRVGYSLLLRQVEVAGISIIISICLILWARLRYVLMADHWNITQQVPMLQMYFIFIKIYPYEYPILIRIYMPINFPDISNELLFCCFLYIPNIFENNFSRFNRRRQDATIVPLMNGG